MIKVCVDPGSTHMQNLNYAKELIDLATEANCWAIKFQLFQDLPPNIELPREWWGDLVEYAKGKIILFASAFDMGAIELLKTYSSPYVKFSFSHRKWWRGIEKARKFSKVIVSCSPYDSHFYPKDIIRLFCVPKYPVTHMIDHKKIYKRYPFDGFSDHTLSYHQTFIAIAQGAKIIEKHITLDHPDIKCPDHYFALRPKELHKMMEVINAMSKDKA